jgi:hypothetical protein
MKYRLALLDKVLSRKCLIRHNINGLPRDPSQIQHGRIILNSSVNLVTSALLSKLFTVFVRRSRVL